VAAAPENNAKQKDQTGMFSKSLIYKFPVFLFQGGFNQPAPVGL